MLKVILNPMNFTGLLQNESDPIFFVFAAEFYWLASGYVKCRTPLTFPFLTILFSLLSGLCKIFAIQGHT